MFYGWDKREMQAVFWWGNLVERDSLEDSTLLAVLITYHWSFTFICWLLQFYFKATTTNTNPAKKTPPTAIWQGQLSSAGHCNKKYWVGDKWCGRSDQQSPKDGKINNLKKTIDFLRWTNFKLLSQIKKNQQIILIFFLICNSCPASSLWLLAPNVKILAG